jgi:hypothetical protein
MSRRGRIVFAGAAMFPAPERPKPTYPGYEQLLADAEDSVRRDGRHIDPAKMRDCRALPRDRRWRIAVLGCDRPPTLTDVHMLLLAHERDLDPPPPPWFVAQLDASARAEEERAAKVKAREDADQAAWDAVRQLCQVEVEVRRNGTARPRFGYAHHLGHVVPFVDARSGRNRRHRAGRALCESERRARPLDLSGGVDGPATCGSCLDYTPKIRLASV